ncbi:hypothetical protein CTAYLR_010070 [Chrysophaeum taylorii]|uniref:Iron hydrogenase large subunit C-terminal domain-containing protein n=1 Tax=Chrysophaeum taylorii TaxID=2483200 RepID=A0AAD7XJJ1_9STRA|nr:hypothetical protein CTAYLR_010070 [Chrysophaeum taylorii]
MASVFLADLDADVIGLGADCTNPQFVKPPAKKKTTSNRKGRVELSMEEDVVVGVGVMRSVGGRAAVSVSDCLACSGCVTSAETVLLSRDSTGEFNAMRASGERVEVSVSQASLASIAAQVGASTGATFGALRRLLAPATVAHVASALDLALLELADEFLGRVRVGTRDAPVPEPTRGVSSERILRRDVEERVGPARRREDGPLPLVVAECPGVVCFVEKTAAHALPYLASTKSAMATFGALKSDTRHVSVVPCADKKLEAARKDLSRDGTPDVDLALTTKEAVDAVGGVDTIRAALRGEEEGEPWVVSPASAGSGGYLEFVYRAAAKAFGATVPDRLDYVRVRNDDFHEVDLALPDGLTLKFARAYGFRNVQRVASALKRGSSPYHFVELMACPSGCLNGGGQLFSDDETSRDQARRRIALVDAAFHAGDKTRDPRAGPLAGRRHALADVLHTRYHNIPPLETNPKW